MHVGTSKDRICKRDSTNTEDFFSAFAPSFPLKTKLRNSISTSENFHSGAESSAFSFVFLLWLVLFVSLFCYLAV